MSSRKPKARSGSFSRVNQKAKMMALAGTKLRSWRSRLDAANRKVKAVADEIRESGDTQLIERLEQSDCYLNDAISILATTIECRRDPRGKRPQA